MRRAAINHRAVFDLETWMLDVRCWMFDVSLRLTPVLDHRQRPAVRRLRQFCNRGVQLYRVAKLRRQRVWQNLQSFVERKLRRAVLGHLAGFFAVARAKNLTFDERAVFVLQRLELRKRMRQGKLVWVARVNSGHERVNCLIEKFLVQPAHDELRDAFLDAIAAARH